MRSEKGSVAGVIHIRHFGSIPTNVMRAVSLCGLYLRNRTTNRTKVTKRIWITNKFHVFLRIRNPCEQKISLRFSNICCIDHKAGYRYKSHASCFRDILWRDAKWQKCPSRSTLRFRISSCTGSYVETALFRADVIFQLAVLITGFSSSAR